MCGILLLVANTQNDQQDASAVELPGYYSSLKDVCHKRGPHSLKSVQIPTQHGLTVHLTSSVLSLRGEGCTPQPISSQDQTIFLAWNGQVYAIDCSGPSQDESGRQHRAQAAADQIAAGENDGEVLMSWIAAAVSHYQQHQGSTRSQAVVSALHEVFAAIEAEWAMAIVDTQTGTVYYGRDPIGRRSLLLASPQDDAQHTLPLLLASTASQQALAAGVEFQEVDCSAIWAYDTVSRQTTRIVQRGPARAVLKELRNPQLNGMDHFLEPTPAERERAAQLTHEVLLESVRQRVTSITGQTLRDIQAETKLQASTPSPVAILFSGGLDSTLLAYYAHLVLPPQEPIDLLNVAFENPRVLNAKNRDQAKAESTRFDTPDRVLSRVTTAHLSTLCPTRRWRLIEINVTYEEYTSSNADILATMSPSDSVMDLSLASVLYFASRGTGRLSDGSLYTTHARVYISGLGADELCGGYSRHRKAFENGSWPAVVDELQMDLDRLHTRNLGRDDRILSCHSREARYPFLAVPFIELLASLPIRVKAELTLPLGQGEKYLLRDLAKRCGLVQTASEKKRAMQWGARSAKMEAGQGRVKGHQRLDASKSTAGKDVVVVGEHHSDVSQAPEEVFTTLCYFPKAPLPGKEYPVDELLPLHLRPIYQRHQQPPQTNQHDALHTLHSHIPLLSAHLDRLRISTTAMQDTFPAKWSAAHAAARETSLSTASLLATLQSHLDQLDEDEDAKQTRPRRVRMALTSQGDLHITQALMPAPATSTTTTNEQVPAPPRTVRLDTQSTAVSSARDKALLLNKTSSRAVYDEARDRVNATMGLPASQHTTTQPCFDVVMWSASCNGEKYITESSIANILIEYVDARIVTPRLASGSQQNTCFLPGLMRSHLLAIGMVSEEDVTVGELQRLDRTSRKIYLCNALRGLVEVDLVD